MNQKFLRWTALQANIPVYHFGACQSRGILWEVHSAWSTLWKFASLFHVEEFWFTVNCKSTYWNFSLAVRCDHTVKLLKRITVPSKCCFHGTYLGQNGLQFLMLQLPNTLLKLLLGNSFISNLKVTQESRLLPLSSIIWPDSTKHPLYHFCFK